MGVIEAQYLRISSSCSSNVEMIILFEFIMLLSGFNALKLQFKTKH